jgi:hypothetical protein
MPPDRRNIEEFGGRAAPAMLCLSQLIGRVGISNTKTDPPPGRGS